MPTMQQIAQTYDEQQSLQRLQSDNGLRSLLTLCRLHPEGLGYSNDLKMPISSLRASPLTHLVQPSGKVNATVDSSS